MHMINNVHTVTRRRSPLWRTRRSSEHSKIASALGQGAKLTIPWWKTLADTPLAWEMGAELLDSMFGWQTLRDTMHGKTATVAHCHHFECGCVPIVAARVTCEGWCVGKHGFLLERFAAQNWKEAGGRVGPWGVQGLVQGLRAPNRGDRWRPHLGAWNSISNDSGVPCTVTARPVGTRNPRTVRFWMLAEAKEDGPWTKNEVCQPFACFPPVIRLGLSWELQSWEETTWHINPIVRNVGPTGGSKRPQPDLPNWENEQRARSGCSPRTAVHPTSQRPAPPIGPCLSSLRLRAASNASPSTSAALLVVPWRCIEEI